MLFTQEMIMQARMENDNCVICNNPVMQTKNGRLTCSKNCESTYRAQRLRERINKGITFVCNYCNKECVKAWGSTDVCSNCYKQKYRSKKINNIKIISNEHANKQFEIAMMKIEKKELRLHLEVFADTDQGNYGDVL